MNRSDAINPSAWIAGWKTIKTRCASCKRSMSPRQIASGSVGIRMRGSWLCSSACFTTAAAAVSTLLLRPEPGNARTIDRMPLGLLFMSKGILTQVQLRELTAELRQCGGEMGELLVRRGSVSEKQVAAARALQWGCPVFTMPTYAEPTNVYIPWICIRRYSAVPVHFTSANNMLLVGFTDAIDYGLLYAIEQMTGYKTQPCFVTRSDFAVQIDREVDIQRRSGTSMTDEVTFNGVPSAEELASALCTWGIDMEAEEVILERCKEHLWARLICGSHKVDRLFKVA